MPSMTESGKSDAQLIATKWNRAKYNITRVHEGDFVNRKNIKMESGGILPIPATPDDNRNASIIAAELVRQFVTNQIKVWETDERVFTPTELKEIVNSVKLANETCIVAHEQIYVPETQRGKPGNTATGQMLKGVEAMAKGIAQGTAEAQNEAMKKFIDASKKIKQAEAVKI